ncbi:MAG TPA: ABC transporter ATP-binding protein [Candidatus Baltobacteraceae bacterium]|nr:ABC transporter ATP-binding protein [Candidatus Baltobacteraceae bacterium]
MSAPQPALRLRGIGRSFPGVRAVDDVDLDLFAGEIHALVGENGAGKSTLANIAFGALRADEGTVEAAGTVGLVHQHFQLVGRLSVWQNVLLGREPRRGWRIDARQARERVSGLAQQNGLEIEPDAYVDELPVGVQQRVELLRELEREPAVLLLDEPTAALAPAEIDSFFKTITALAQRGTAIMIVTHKLQEVIAYSKRVSVMRHGRITGRFETAATSIDEIARAMVGGDLPTVAQRAAVTHTPCFRMENVTAGSGGTAIRGISLEVAAGEIVGIAGVEGNGQTTLTDAVAGMIPHTGTVTFASAQVRTGVIPQDRHREGLVLGWSIVENAILGRQRSRGIRRGVMIDRQAAREDAQRIVRSLDVRAASLDAPVKTLSGGNQQKIVVGRALLGDPQFVLAYQPTRGIDVGAAALVQSRLIEARNAGAAVLLISFELDEVLALADRVLVMYRGAIAGSFSGAQIDRARIGRLMAGSAA